MRRRSSSRVARKACQRSSSAPATKLGSSIDQLTRCLAPGQIGQSAAAASQTVTTTSKGSSMNFSADLERARPIGKPSSSIARMASGWTKPAGRDPAETGSSRSW